MAYSPMVELQISGVWTDVSSYVRYQSGISITRGKQNEQGDLQPSRCTMTLNNRDGRFSNRNPASIYFGKLGRNTPMRVSVNGLPGYLRQSASAGRVWAPDSAALDITGDLDLRVDVEPDYWSVSTRQTLLSKSLTTGNQRSWHFSLNATGQLELGWSAAGTSPFEQALSTMPTRFTGRHTVRVTLDVNDGGNHTVTFYVGDSVTATTWTQLGDPITTAGTTSIFAGTADLEVGSANVGTIVFGSDSRFAGKINRAQVRNGINGAVVADADFTSQASGATSFSDGSNTWSLTGAVSISAKRYRFFGEVASWPSKWDLSGKDVYVPIEAGGITRRLTQGASPLRSAIYRNLSRYSPVGYWPFEDDSDAEAAASAVSGGSAASVTSVTFAGDDTLPGSASAVTLNDTTTRITGTVRKSLPSGATGYSIMFFFKLPAIPGADNKLFAWSTSGTATTWQITVSTATYKLDALAADGTSLISSVTSFGAGGEPNKWIAMQLETEYVAGTTNWTLLWHSVGTTTFYSTSGSYSGTSGNVRAWSVTGQTYLTGASFGHVYVGANTLPFVDGGFSASSNGYRGESARARLGRLCSEQGVPYYIQQATNTDDSPLMGRQRVATFMELIGEVETVDQGMLTEPVDFLGISYLHNSLLTNQPGPTFNYGQHIAEPFEPVDDDQVLRNAVTVSRPGGSSSTTEQTDGPLSVLDPPAGVGRYDDSVEANVYTDGQLVDLSSWLVHLGTWDALRYPQITFLLHDSQFSASPARMLQAVTSDLGCRFIVASLPSWLPPDPADCLIQGYTEAVTPDEWQITFNATPGDLYDIAQAGSDLHVDLDGSTLSTAVNASATTLVLAHTGVGWSVNAADYPFDVGLTGERITLNSPPGGSTSPQTFTGVTRSVNGIPKSHLVGEAVTLWTPAYVAL